MYLLHFFNIKHFEYHKLYYTHCCLFCNNSYLGKYRRRMLTRFHHQKEPMTPHGLKNENYVHDPKITGTDKESFNTLETAGDFSKNLKI